MFNARAEYDDLFDTLTSGSSVQLASTAALMYLGSTLQECVDVGANAIIAREDWRVTDYPGIFLFHVFDICAAIQCREAEPRSPILLGCARLDGQKDQLSTFVALANRILENRANDPLQSPDYP